MRGDLFGVPTWNTECRGPSDLILIWKSITYSLISAGHVAELYEALDSASGTGRAGATGDPPSDKCYEEACHGPTLLYESQQNTNCAETNRSASNIDSEDEDAMSLDGSEIDDIYDLDIPSSLIDDAADLSRYNHGDTPPSFEEVLAQERSLLRCKGQRDEPEGTVCFDGDSLLAHPPSVRLLPVDAHQSQLPNLPALDTASEQSVTLGVEAREISFEGTEPNPPRNTAMARGLRVSDKRDLTPPQILVVTSLLIRKDSISYFLDNCHLLYKGWMLFAAQRPVVKNDVEASVIDAFDTVQGLVKGNRIRRLLLRLAFIHLARVIDTYKAVAAADRVQGKASRNVGQRDASVAIDIYLREKRKVSSEEIKRSRLSGYCRSGRRWAELAGPTPILVFVFPQVAETIVYVPPLLPPLSLPQPV